MPEWIADNKDACDLWSDMHRRLSAMRIWSEQFTEMLAVYCMTYAHYREALRDAEGEPTVIVSEKGGAYPNPLWTRVRVTQSDMVKLAGEFGCTPAAKTHIRVEKDTKPGKSLKQKYGVVS